MNKMIHRNLDIENIIKKKSLFLLGPRQTGKTTYLKDIFSEAKIYSLLSSDVFLRLSKDPSLIRRELDAIRGKQPIVVIDEIQKLPILLDEVHYLIEEKKTKFILTGSSARKLKRSGVNLLAGRASWINFNPFNFAELGKKFDLLRVLQYGTLPPVWLSDDPWSYLKDYVDLYLREEIMSEGLTRSLPSFSRFIEVAALCNGQIINYTKIANDSQVSKTTTYEYFQVLKDTLIATEVPAFGETKKRKAVASSKFYFFDNGVVRFLQGRDNLTLNSSDFGDAFESYFFHELKSYSNNNNLSDVMYWRSVSGFEVDFILNKDIAIELKSTKRVNNADLKGLRALKEEKLMKKYILVSLDEKRQKWDGIECIYYKDFLKELWSGEIMVKNPLMGKNPKTGVPK